MYGVLFPLSFCQQTWFSIQNLNISLVLETSRNFLEVWKLPGIGLFSANFDMGYQYNFIFVTEPKFAKIIINIGVTWKFFMYWIPDFQKSRSALELANYNQFQCMGYFFHSVFVNQISQCQAISGFLDVWNPV